MKRLFCYCSFLLLSNALSAQNVGVGETSPGAKLTIKASDAFNKSLLIKTSTNDTATFFMGFNHYIGGYTNTSVAALTLNNKYFLPFDNTQLNIVASGERVGINANGSLSTIEFRNINNTNGSRFSFSAYLGNTVTHNMGWYYYNPDDGGSKTLLYFTQAGNAGMGTVTPAEKLDVVGNINASGIVRAGEVHRTSTGTSNLVPIAYGNISSAGFVQTGSGNIAVTKIGTGWYQITITGEAYQFQSYTTVVTAAGNIGPIMTNTGSGGGNLYVYTYNATGASGTAADSQFCFVVYKQ
jgi:hypothetical protein